MKRALASAISPHEQALKEHAEWEWQFGQVEAFVRQHGHAELGAHPAGEWLRWQMRRAEAGELTAERRKRLEALGMTLPAAVKQGRKKAARPLSATVEDDWERLFARLDAWQQLHGHCEVWPEGPDQAELARWVKEQRRLHVAQRLTEEQSARLDALGLFRDRSGTDRAQLWEQRFQELAAYAREHGHTNVTRAQNLALANWRDTQRESRRKGMLKAERVAR
ncbi:MAG: helicase associated domain-containing protein, partial [Verrucomicrobiaceae bacterium]|nr:helicase associated domain-containing protein [Verrucomicrobiaceae bacterium]